MIGADLYARGSAPALRGRQTDKEWFLRHPEATFRVRPLLEGESPFLDAMIAAGHFRRGYAIVINHRRAGDCRARFGVGVYPVGTAEADRAAARTQVDEAAARMAEGFRRTPASSPPFEGAAVIRLAREGSAE